LIFMSTYFGQAQDTDGRVATSGIGLASISLVGFREVYKYGLPELILEDKHTFKFCTLLGIVLLKLIPWDDGSEARRDDIKDISDILHRFFDMYAEIIYENHNDLFENHNDNLAYIAAQVLGREIKKIADRNPILHQRINRILTENTDAFENSRIGQIMTEYFENTIADNVLLLRQLKQGFEARPHPKNSLK